MKHRWLLLLLICLWQTPLLFSQVSSLNPIANPSMEELRSVFVAPPCEFSTGPLWTWNDRLTEEQVRGTLNDLAGQNVKQVWVHPRPGLMTPYLSDEWFDMWKISLDEAEKLDMKVWIYDENSYPSGFAGGFVPEALPDSRGKGMVFREVNSLNEIPKETLFIFEPNGVATDGTVQYKDITESANNAGKLASLDGDQKYLLANVHEIGVAGWFADRWYVDILLEGVTEKFIEITNDAYKREISDEFGKRVPGIFTDEPHPPAPYLGTWISWNKEIPAIFEEMFGYSLIESIPALNKHVGDWQKVRHDYHAMILHLFVERWSKPNFAWCEENNMEWTGHYWEHGWPLTTNGPDNMAMYIWHQRPAIDLLMNTYNAKSSTAQFGNIRAGRELASIANQMGHSRTLSENYGAGGWDLRFEDMKRLSDWSYAVGVNTLNEHVSYVTIRGARKRDHPQSFSYHSPWFEGYHALADYYTRLSYLISQGKQEHRIVILEPTTTAWMYQDEPILGKLGQSFTDFVNLLERYQIEYDLASEDTIGRLGAVTDGQFRIHDGKYDLVILPPFTENLNEKTAVLLEQFAKAGGKIICLGDIPNRIDGATVGNEQFAWLKSYQCEGITNDEVAATLRALIEPVGGEGDVLTVTGPLSGAINAAIGVSRGETDNAKSMYSTARFVFSGSDTIAANYDDLYHHRRVSDDYEVLFLCNSSSTPKTIRGTVGVSQPTGDLLLVEQYDLHNGKRQPVTPRPATRDNQRYSLYDYEIPACGSLLLVLSKKETVKQVADKQADLIHPGNSLAGTSVVPMGNISAKRLEDNVLTIDYVDLNVGDEKIKDLYVCTANNRIYQKHGFKGNPWDSAVQFKDELITRTFESGSGFDATYRFTLEDGIPNNLAIVIEKPENYIITCNGKPTPWNKTDWWLDKSFGKIDLSQVAQVGANEVKIVANPMRIEYELESAYLLGDFSVVPAEKGFVVKAAQPLELGAAGWKSQGMPFYSGKVAYSASVNIDSDKSKYYVALPDSPAGWYGATAEIFVNGKSSGFLISTPWNTEITDLLRQGENEISVVVYGAPKNLLGPHHSGPHRGSAWPGSFIHAPERQPAGAAYDFIEYGMFQPFELLMKP